MTSTEGMRAFYVPIPVEDDNSTNGRLDNPHVCILEDVPCLACALIEVLGESERDTALDLAAQIAANESVDLEGGE